MLQLTLKIEKRNEKWTKVDIKEVDLGFFEISYTYHRNERLQQGMNQNY
jgi:hypothetical protein